MAIRRPLRSLVVEVVDGQVHAVAHDGVRRLDDGECNLDDAAHALRELPFPVIVESTRLCGHCWTGDEIARLPTTRDSSSVIIDERFR